VDKRPEGFCQSPIKNSVEIAAGVKGPKMDAVNRFPSIGEIIDQRPLSRFQSVTMLLCGIVLVLDGFATQSIGFLAPSMAQSLHVSVHTFGPVFAAALIGLMVSSMAAGPIADRVGRKGPIIVATLIFGAFSVATARSVTFNELVIFRFLSGLGFGAAIPNAVALTAEYAPKRLQQTVITVLFASMPLGALLGGLVSSVMLPRWGWRSVFYTGGILPLMIGLILIKVLPESLRFLAASGRDRQSVRRIFSRIAPELKELDFDMAPAEQEQRLAGVPVAQLFSEGRAVGTILLWVPFFMNLLMLYFMVTWLPALLQQRQMTVLAGVFGISIFSFGGIVGSLLQGRAMNAWGGFNVLFSEFVLCLFLISSLALVAAFPLMMVVTFLCGGLIQGAQAGLNALSATYYPTWIRSTGVGWALGVGRLGSIVGPLLGGIVLSQHWSLSKIFFSGATPALLAALAIMLSRALSYGNSPYRQRSAAEGSAL
jgi:MFS transporter, AAHS family, 4-hydroxybenzoate transporter